MANLPTIPLVVRFIDFEVQINLEGQFSTTYADRQFSAATLDGLREMLVKATRAAAQKMNIEFTWYTGEDAAVYGVHAGTNNLLIREATGRSIQKGAYDMRRSTMRRLSPAEHAAYEELLTAAAAASANLVAFRTERDLDVWTAAREALDREPSTA